MAAVPLAALAALGGTYSSSTLPLLAAAACAFLASGARVAQGEWRSLDYALLAFLAAVVLQLMPLPGALAHVLSPAAGELREMLALTPARPFAPLSIDARLTREGLATASAAVLVFWAAREVFATGGVRIVARTLAAAGFAVALVGLIGRATAPTLLLWTWAPLDPGAQPYGPFVNRNHFAAWLLLAAATTCGYLIAHLRERGAGLAGSPRLLVRDFLADGSAVFLAGAVGVMLVALVASGSRAALLGLAAALAIGLLRPSVPRGGAARWARLFVLLLAAGAVWANRDVVAGRLDATLSARAADRPVIWRETLPMLSDFAATGTGLGTYAQAMLRYQRTTPSRLFNQAHNEYLQLAAEGGALLTVPAAVALVVWVSVVRRRLHAPRGRSYWIRVGALAGVGGVAVQCAFESALRLPANAFLAALLAAVLVHERALKPPSTSASGW